MSKITHEYITEYLNELYPESEGMIYELEKQAQINHVPIIPIGVKSLVCTILSIIRPERVLEIGTAIGYSAVLMSQFLQNDGQITTIERNPIMIDRAKRNFQKFNLSSSIHLLEGDAEKILPQLHNHYDVIFMDAAKGQYKFFLEQAYRLLKNGGVLIADNVLQKGLVAKSRYTIPRRQRTIHKRMRNFLWEIQNSPYFQTSVIPVGDGVTIAHKVKGEPEIDE